MPIQKGPIITAIRVRGFRALADVTIYLKTAVNAVVGENGSGKSTLLEALELLRRAAGAQFWNELNAIHGGVSKLRRFGAKELVLGVDVGCDGGELSTYEIAIGDDEILRERCSFRDARPGASVLDGHHFIRTGGRIEYYAVDENKFGKKAVLDVTTTQTAIHALAMRDVNPAVVSVWEALAAIRVHVPFEVMPRWIAQAHNRKSEMRVPQQLFAAKELDRLGPNIASCFDALIKEQSAEEREFTMDLVRHGLGDWVEEVVPRTDDAGQVSLWIKIRGRDDKIPPSGISDGQLAYLAFVALTRLPFHRSVLAFDEPELHLHPKLLSRVLGLFDRLGIPVLLSTHSRRLLDALDDPAEQAILFELDPKDLSTRVLRPDARALSAWLKDYDGLGEMLDAGLAHAVMSDLKS